MNRNFLLTITLASLVLAMGCVKNSPTSPSPGQFSEATANAFSNGRYGLSGTVFNGQMWAIGGASGPVTTYYSDVYSSSSGSSWTKVNASAPFGGRYGSQVLSYNGQLWLIGGNSNGTLMNDVWNSTDGKTWTQVLAPTSGSTATQFSPREDFGALVYNNTMWVMGGFSMGGSTNDVWSSTDGKVWTKVTTPASVAGSTLFQRRWGLSAVVYNNAMWVLMGAYSVGTNSDPTTVYSDVWTSTTGSTWTQVSVSKIWPIYYCGSSVFNNQIWLTGGFVPSYGSKNFVQYTSDGINWGGALASFPYRFYDLALSFNGALWVIAGCDDFCDTDPCPPISYLNDVWYTQ